MKADEVNVGDLFYVRVEEDLISPMPVINKYRHLGQVVIEVENSFGYGRFILKPTENLTTNPEIKRVHRGSKTLYIDD